MLKVHLPFQCNSCSLTILGLSVPVQAFWYPRLWLLLVACAQDGFNDIGISLMVNVMGVDHFPGTQHSSITRNQSMRKSSITTPDQGLNSAHEQYIIWLEQFPKIEKIMVSKIF